MRSLIILEVEHGEDTDALTGWIEFISEQFRVENMFGDGDSAVLKNYAVRVDVPECFVLD